MKGSFFLFPRKPLFKSFYNRLRHSLLLALPAGFAYTLVDPDARGSECRSPMQEFLGRGFGGNTSCKKGSSQFLYLQS